MLSDLIREKVDEIRDDSLYDDRVREEDEQKDQLDQVSQRWSDVVEFLQGN